MLESQELKKLGYLIKKRDDNAFEILYRKGFNDLQRYAMRYVYNWDEAENIVQDAYFSLWLHIDKYNPSKNVFTYLFVIVKNSCLNYIRNLKIQDEHQDKIIEGILFSSIEDSDIDDNIKNRLNDILSKISEKQKKVLNLHVIEKKSIKEIAAIMNVSPETVKTHYKRVMQILRTNLRFILLSF